MESRADDDEAPTDPAARKHTHHDYTEQDFEGIMPLRVHFTIKWLSLDTERLVPNLGTEYLYYISPGSHSALTIT
ncbi:hypothetical protein EVAR_13468_1 [Eumeta japonica]|uniref:Uncharacterized protein n=1 Tax=Eumeta variegata TaxID=151549 RepID=A0A4C1UYK6_EUMVA|nr:hypothetical protein EVAR_13468_1 [Eumeta japonica]